MKSTTAHYILLLYVTVILRPLLPIANDWWQHEFNNIEHLACVHAVYGNNHLQKELADYTNKSKSQTGIKTKADVSFHIPAYSSFKCVPITINTCKKYLGFYIFQLPISILSNLAPPPKF